MIKICKQNKESLLRKIYNGDFDNVASSISNLVDDIILSMYKSGILSCISAALTDRRAHNTTVPFELVIALSVAAKMKSNTSITDIPYAITDHRVIAELGYNIIGSDRDLKDGMMTESSLRFLFGKYDASTVFSSYNKAVQDHIMKKLDIVPNIHILDCTELSVNLKNQNYEQSAVTINKYDEMDRGYKLATLRGLVEDTGLIEEIEFGAMNVHDLELSRNMLKETKVFNPGDILIEDRGFIDRDLINFLKRERQTDTYVPLRSNMVAYKIAVDAAKEENNWEEHPTRKGQKITLITDLGPLWQSKNPNDDVDINGCVVWDEKSNNYFVFVTTDTSISAKQITLTYELRPEIEEDYRQLKDFWKLQDFKSTKLNMISMHIIMVLFGYLFFQLYTLLPEGEQYAHKSLPTILKNYQPQAMPYLIFYAGYEFGVFSIAELLEIYPLCDKNAQERLSKFLQ